MAATFEGVAVLALCDSGDIVKRLPFPVILRVADECDSISLTFKNAENAPECLLEDQIYKSTDTARFGKLSCIFTNESKTSLLQFRSEHEMQQFYKLVEDFKGGRKNSNFTQRTEDSSASQYFQFYGYLSQQQNMMQDYIRTSTYQRAILANMEDFKDKVVLDVGAGSGILSFFAAQAGARKVYAIEASSMAKHAENLVYHNKLSGRIVVIPGKVEEIVLPEMVHVIISEPMGYMLFNERMLETYLHAKKWLLPGGKMFPSRGDLHVAPFSDASLYMEQLNKANFWYQQSFHGVDLCSLREAALKEYFRQPVVDTFDIRSCMAKSLRHTVDFETITEFDLHRIEVPLHFLILQPGELHGLAFWFDVAFLGSRQTVWLSTSPTQPLTHWYQVRCLLETPFFVQRGQVVSGLVVLNSNKRQSYDVEIELRVDGTTTTASNTLDLKNPFFRYTGQAPQAPPGYNDTSPSESYWQTIDTQSNGTASNLVVNGISLVNGTTVLDVHAHPYGQQQSHGGSHQSSIISLDGSEFSVNETDEHFECYPSFGTGWNRVKIISSQFNHGSLPSPGTVSSSGKGSSRMQANVPTSSIGGGISPSLFSQQVALSNSAHFPVNNSLMIGDYATPGNLVMQDASNGVFKH